MPRFKVTWINVVSYSCTHEVEADNEDEAIEICRTMDASDIKYREESDQEDKEFDTEEC